MARRKPATAEGAIEDQLRDFEQAPGIPKNLGNFPDELDPDPRLQARTPEPEPEPEPETQPEAPAQVAAPEPVEDREEAEDPRLAELQERLDRQQREMEFLRAGYQQGVQVATPQVQPGPQDVVALIDQYLGGLNISEADAQLMMQDPAKFVEFAKNGLRAAAAAGAAISMQQLRAEYGQARQGEQSAQQIRQYFYGKNPDLEPYQRVVGPIAIEVWNQLPAATNEQRCEETARRTRAELKAMGVKAPAGTAPARQTRTRPAFGEMGGGHRASGGNRALSPIEKQLRDFEQGTNAYLRG